MHDILLGMICICGSAVAFALGLLMLKRRRAALAWAEEKAVIAECARADHVFAEQLQLLRYIHEHWPETISVALDPRHRLTPETQALLQGEPLRWEMLQAFYRDRPSSVHVTLRSRQHKMQICDAQRLGLQVAVQSEVTRDRPNPREVQVVPARDPGNLQRTTTR